MSSTDRGLKQRREGIRIRERSFLNWLYSFAVKKN